MPKGGYGELEEKRRGKWGCEQEDRSLRERRGGGGEGCAGRRRKEGKGAREGEEEQQRECKYSQRQRLKQSAN